PHVNGDRVVPEPGFSAELDPFDEPRRSALIEPPTAEFRIDERPQPHMRDASRPPGRDVAKELADHPLRKVVAFDLSRQSEPAEARREPPVSADAARHKRLVREMIEPARLAISLAGAVNQR